MLANVWNAESARIVEKACFSALGTSSGAIAASLGYKDGEQIPFDELLYIVKRIKASTSIPLSVDMERGYTNDPATLTQNIQQLLDIGVAGINIEDSQGEEVYLEKLTCIKQYLTEKGQSLFINARADAFLQKLPSPLEVVLRRARRYKEAGADGLFVTGIQDTAIIKQIAGSIELPLNVVGSSGAASVASLAACGVKRISMAVMLFKAAYAGLEKLVTQIHAERSLAALYS